MKKILFASLITALAVNFTSATEKQYINKVKTEENLPFMDCSGEFEINGKSYTITLHDVSLWTCVKFKVASWFN
jgi:hypothetical protein